MKGREEEDWLIFYQMLLNASKSLGSFLSFEHQAIILESQTSVLLITVLSTIKAYSFALTKTSEMSVSFTNHDRILITGDFNLHIDNVSDFNAMDFLQLLHSFDFIQHTAGPTHNCGHTLDLVIS